MKKDELDAYVENNKLTADFVSKHPEIKEFLINKKLSSFIYKKASFIVNEGQLFDFNYYEKLEEVFTNEEILDVMAYYGELFDLFQPYLFMKTNEFPTLQEIEDAIYYYIVEHHYSHELLPLGYEQKHPDLFIAEDAPKDLKDAFHIQKINAETIRKHRKCLNFLKNKNLLYVIEKSSSASFLYERVKNGNLSEHEFYSLCCKYGRFLETNHYYLESHDYYRYALCLKDLNSYYNIDKFMRFLLLKNKDNTFSKGDYSFLAPILKSSFPDLFLDKNAPLKLREKYYRCGGENLEFIDFVEHKDWISYLEGKELNYAFENYSLKIGAFYNMSSKEVFLDLLKKNPLNLEDALENSYVRKVLPWYEKYHFIPQSFVINQIPIEESDSFLRTNRKWSMIMHLFEMVYTHDYEEKEALLKVCKVFGVFDGDDKGYQEIIKLLFTLPTYLSEDLSLYLDFVDDVDLLYVRDKENRYHLRKDVNIKSYDYQYLREVIGKYNPTMIHHLFGGMRMEYNPHFRDFFLENEEKLLESESRVSIIERQFDSIRKFYSNRKITYEAVVDYIESNKYSCVEEGNGLLAELVSNFGYSEEDFEILQKIYKKSKKRIGSTIPRIEGKNSYYSYEILHLDDPIALVIGDITNCCQRLHDVAESCMAHSAIEEGGRVFVVRDKRDCIVSQSWIWREKNTICFDNIEIPSKVLEQKEDISKEILNIYKEASLKLIEKENATYQKYFQQGLLSLEEMCSSIVSKITVGLGYNDIATVIKERQTMDKNPTYIDYLYKGFDVYVDSKTQYILEKNDLYKERNKGMASPMIYHDTYKIYDEVGCSEIHFLKSLFSLSLDMSKMIHYIDEISEDINLKEELSSVYHIDPSSCKVMMNHSFAIVYEERDEEIYVKDIFYNKEEETLQQIDLGIEQLSENKTVVVDEDIKYGNKKKFIKKK